MKAKRRGKKRRLFALTFVSMTLLAGFGVLVYIQTRPRWEWYVSPPFDAQGHRVHILCPVDRPKLNWIDFWDFKDDRDYAEMRIYLGPIGQQDSIMRRLFVKLHLLPENNTHKWAILMVGRAIYPGSSPLGHYITVNNAAEENSSGRTADYVWVSRTKVAVPRDLIGVRVRYEGPVDDEDSLAIGTEVCKRFYVK